MANENFDRNMVDLFKQEANKHILKVNNSLLSIEKEGIKKEILSELKREVHTLKGDSRMLGFGKISDASHKLEDLFDLIAKNEKTIDARLIENLFKSLDIIQKAVDKLPEEEIDIDIESLISGKVAASEISDDKIEIFNDSEIDAKEDIEKEKLKKINTTPEEKKKNQDEEKEVNFISLRLKKIDELINLFSAFPRYVNRFGFILNQLKEINNKIDKKYHDDDISKALELILYDFSHEITFYDLISKQFQNEIAKIKLVPLSTIFDLFPRLVRDIAQQTNKKINFIIKGKEVELDKGVVEKLKEILIHIINNAVEHGCEEPDIREKMGKQPEGTIILSAYNKGDNVIIEIIDDGSGVDIDKVREKAVEKGLISREKANITQDEDMVKFIFEAGFSTKKVGKFSGRGIGMDVVSNILKEMNGEIKVNTWKNKGTTFIISLPLISFFIPVTIFEIGGKVFGLPSMYIMQALRLKANEIKTVGGDQNFITLDNTDISLLDLKNFFGFGADFIEKIEKTEDYRNILIIKYLDEITGLIISDIILEKKMVIKKIIGLSNKLKIIIGTVLMGNERAIPVLNIPELFKIMKNETIAITKFKNMDERKKIWAKNILLVDDSIITREHEKEILLNQNLNVFEASNGKEAIKYLENQAFDMIITDIEMPVMDGLELIKYIKNNEKLSNIPIVVVSSYKDYKTKVEDIGVKHFVNKSEFISQVFIGILKEENII